eukprot:TRINITY_DN50685_c0_g1_i1.p1 TRINITY_DN50685_c0_g1~~TRINITY_DN50685_c0_g1_i1.p1  ORF type:complete len:353 (+),score=75.09 TRINITY_DN50685_c0_g1_i1:173-1231(+)
MASLIRACAACMASQDSITSRNQGAKALTDAALKATATTHNKQPDKPKRAPKPHPQEAARSPPDAPPELEARGNGSSSLKLAWVPPASGSSISAYDIRMLQDDEWRVVHQSDQHTTSHTLTGLDHSTRYCVGVRAVNKDGPGPWKTCAGTTAAPMHYSPLPAHLEYNGSDFGKEGLLYWIGTKEGTERDWRNPAMTGDVNVTVSSKDGGSGSGALARMPSKLCTENQEDSWVALRFLKHRITVHGYALRLSRPCGDMAAGVCYAPRSWVLEASDDGDYWEAIHEHHNDSLLSLEKPVALWKVTSTDNPFCHLRIRMTGPNARGTEGGRHRLAIAGIELYGIVVANSKVAPSP